MSDVLPLTPSVEQLSRIIGSVAAPAFLLGAVAAFISVLISRMNRVIDRSQFIHAIADEDVAPPPSFRMRSLARQRRQSSR